MKVSRRGVKFVAGFEGFRSCPYRDAVGVWTIGYGETQGVGPGTKCISKRKARKMLRRRITNDYAAYIPRPHQLKQQEIDALASFAYNLGVAAVSDPGYSSLARRLRSKEGRTFAARQRIYQEEMPKWCRAGGVPLLGLVKRRSAEVRLACRGDYSGHP